MPAASPPLTDEDVLGLLRELRSRPYTGKLTFHLYGGSLVVMDAKVSRIE